MSLLKLRLHLGLLRFKNRIRRTKLMQRKEKNNQRWNFFVCLNMAATHGCDHYHFDEDEINLILDDLYEAGYKIEKAKYNQFRVSGW